ncbi:MAG: hypothetical protein SW019_09100 [Actinomycetota bacterium]|nr:hypothetical protein [Actinomycetota bacterium]
MATDTGLRPHADSATRRDGSGPDNRLSLLDHAGIQLVRATGRKQLMQVAWIYEHPVDYERLEQFHRGLGYGLAGRRVERSVLPFGRHRWVSVPGPQAPLQVSPRRRDRSELSDWLDERAQIPVDPERGPGWHVGVLPMTDGSTAITMVGSHNLGDGIAGVLSVLQAVNGTRPDFGYPPPRSRSRLRAAAADLRLAARELPEAARVAAAAGKLILSSRGEPGPAAAGSAGRRDRGRCDCTVAVPAISIVVDVASWDARAEALAGNSYSLLAGVAAKIGERMGRARASDGAVTLSIALNERTGLDDTRALALSFAKASVDPAAVTTDLSGTRTTLRHALKEAREATDASLELLPVVPWVPKGLLARYASQFHGSTEDLSVYCSNLGDLDAAVGRPDGTDAEYVLFRGVDQDFRRHDMEEAGGQLVVVAGRVNGKISIGITAYQLDSDNSKARLREVAAQTLAEFELSGVID